MVYNTSVVWGSIKKMVTVSDSTIRQNVFEIVYDIINSITFSIGSVTVTGAFKEHDTVLPAIAIHPVDVSKDNFSFGSNSRKSDKQVVIMLDIWTKKNKDKDVIADEIDVKLESTTFSGLQYVGLEESNALETPGYDKKLHLKTLTLTFMRR